MTIDEYYRLVQQPAYVALEAVRRAGLPVHEGRARAQMDAWQAELLDLERYVEGEAQSRGFALKFSPAHKPLPDAVFRDYLFSPKGLGLEIGRRTEKRQIPAVDDEVLLPYAAVGPNHNVKDGEPFEDHPIVYAMLSISSIRVARATHLAGLLNFRRADGCVHAKFNWNKPNTTRPSAEDPPIHQIPERSNPEVAKLVKACIVPREGAWLGDPAEWNPRHHGWIGRVDVKGAEMVVRAGCFARCDVLGPYLREGRDSHGRTASALYGKPEGYFAKDSNERNVVGKQSNWILIFGGGWGALQLQLRTKGRMHVSDETAQRWHATFFRTYPRLGARYLEDTLLAFERGYIEDPYGRRWVMPPPEGVRLLSTEVRNGDLQFDVPKGQGRAFNHVRHCYANRPTQAAQATTLLWDIALCYHGEYVELRVPSCWERHGLPFPEAAGWQLNGGEGPGGKPFRVWINNEVHDSKWADGAPDTLEPAMKVLVRRSMGVPADFMLDADQPRRVGMEVGPDLGHLREYNVVAKEFGLEEMPAW